MADTEIPQDVKRIAHEVFCRWNEEDGGHALAERAIMADRASRAPDPSRDGLVEALRGCVEAINSAEPDRGWGSFVGFRLDRAKEALSAIEASK